MKQIRIAILPLILVVSGCAFLQQYATPPNVEAGVYRAAKLALAKITDPVKHEKIRAQTWAAAMAVRQFESTTVPTGAQLQAAIIQYTDLSSFWTEVANDVGAIWDLAVPHFGSGVAQAFSYLEAVARGFERAAAPPLG